MWRFSRGDSVAGKSPLGSEVSWGFFSGYFWEGFSMGAILHGGISARKLSIGRGQEKDSAKGDISSLVSKRIIH